MPRTITQSVGKGGINLANDVKTVQELLNDNIGKIVPLRPLGVDGRIGPMTIGAIEEFQRRVVGLFRPDGRVDPGGRTLTTLNMGAQVRHSVATNFRVVFQHHSKTPDMEKGSDGTDVLYESTATVTGNQSKSFRGSIYPDDLSVKGRLKDGTYDLYLGFHKRQRTPQASDLKVETQGLRAALIVNADRDVPVNSDNPSKTTSSAIHVHNGFFSKRYSEGCPTIHPSDWSSFIQVFLDAYPNLGDWTSQHSYLGKKIGTLEIKA